MMAHLNQYRFLLGFYTILSCQFVLAEPRLEKGLKLSVFSHQQKLPM